MIPAGVPAFPIPNPLDCSPSQFLNLGKCLSGVTKGVANDAFSSIASAFGKAAASAINWLWSQTSSATAIHLGGAAFDQELAVAGAIAVIIALGLFLIQVTLSALRRDPGGIARAGRGLLVCFIAGGVAIGITNLLLTAVDDLSSGVVQVTTGDTMQQLGQAILGAGSISANFTNPAGLILISLFALGAVVMVWLALTIRKVLVVIVGVFAPFAFAGSLADFSVSWTKRWIEFMAALIFSKLILIFVFVTGLEVLLRGEGSTGTGGAQGVTQTVSGVLILALAGFAPFVAIKLAHFVGGHFEAVHASAGHVGAGAGAVYSMAKPVGSMATGGASAGMAGALASNGKKWSPQTPGNTQGGGNGSNGSASQPSPNGGESGPQADGARIAGSASAGPAPASNGSGLPTTAPSGSGSSSGPPSGAPQPGSSTAAPASSARPQTDYSAPSPGAARSTTSGWVSPTGPPPATPVPPTAEGGTP